MWNSHMINLKVSTLTMIPSSIELLPLHPATTQELNFMAFKSLKPALVILVSSLVIQAKGFSIVSPIFLKDLTFL